MADVMKVAVGVIGPGLVGSALIRQLGEQASRLAETLGAQVRVVAIANSRKMAFVPGGVAADDWQAELEKGSASDLSAFGKLLRGADAECHVMVDATASDAPPAEYLDYAAQGIHIVTPNKKFGAGPLARFKKLHHASARRGAAGGSFMAEASCGAGLPVMSTLRSLLETGDRVLSVEGVLSGSLSYIFNTYAPPRAFSDVVADARARGYTEPDPREDLSGMDVARKTVILARECGLDVELSDLKVSSLVPKALAALKTADEFMAALPAHDAEIGQLASEAAEQGKVVRYIGRVDVRAKSCSVELTSVPKDHPFAQLSGADNLIVFTTERYLERPLIVRGPGAGADVTAAGMFTDLVQIIKCSRRT